MRMEKDFIDAIHAKHHEMVAQLHQLCRINSGSDNLAGLQHMTTELQQLFAPLADEVQIHQPPSDSIISMQGKTVARQCGQHLLLRKRPELKRRILLTGHMDTVFNADHPFQSLQYLNDNTLNGPGVADMKGGLLIMFHALQQFEQLPCARQIGWDVLINSDEEIGSPSSAALMDELAPRCQAGLVYEPAQTPEGTLAKNRKGSGKLTLVATGRAAHAGRAFYEGRNAICYMAPLITAIHALNGEREGVTINVGKIAGGEALNIVAENAVIQLDIRISDPSDEHWVRSQLDKIVNAHHQPDYQLDIHGCFARPVKRVNRATERLFLRIQHIAQRLGLRIDWQDSGGCCDGNNIAAHGVPVIDTLGVRGGKIHSSAEFVLLDSLTERVALSALLLQELAEGGLEELQA
ncbi:MAG: hydrolase [Legionellaceae bacterium]|nr:hydrolase [Legionellaceae bacterium]